MNRLKSYIEKWINGEKVRGISVTLLDIHECIDIYNALVRKENSEFINENVKKILNKCGIKTIEKGIGWIAEVA